ncbi:MAG: CGGC domain-containing protein [bacterium]
MKKIAILRCLKSNINCTGAACLKAFNHKKANFACYKDKAIELVAFMSCNGCDNLEFKDDNSGMQEKLLRLIKIGTNILHIGICTQTRADCQDGQYCKEINGIVDFCQNNNIEVRWGTHD